MEEKVADYCEGWALDKEWMFYQVIYSIFICTWKKREKQALWCKITSLMYYAKNVICRICTNFKSKDFWTGKRLDGGRNLNCSDKRAVCLCCQWHCHYLQQYFVNKHNIVEAEQVAACVVVIVVASVVVVAVFERLYTIILLIRGNSLQIRM